MESSNLKRYIEKRNNLSIIIAKGIVDTINSEIQELPEDAIEELGDSIFSSSNDISETILDILAEEEYYEE